MHRPRSARAVAMAAFTAFALSPALASALPPVFLPAPSEEGLLKPGKVAAHARAAIGAQGSYDPELGPAIPFTPSGGAEIGLSKAIRVTADGHGGFVMVRGLDGTVAPASFFGGGRAGLRIVTPTGAPELGFGVGGGVVGGAGPVANAPGLFAPGEPDHGYLSADFEVMASHEVTGGYLSAVARVGPSFELWEPTTEGLPPTVIVSVGGLAEVTAAVELTKTFHLTLGVAVMVGHDGGAVSKDSPVGSPYGGVLGSVGFIAREPAKKK